MKPNHTHFAVGYLLVALGLMGCYGAKNASNPPAPGFNQTDSDPRAIAIADEVMQAMGGRKSWDETCYLTWNFFGRRKLYWNKCTGDVRIESPADSTIYLLNIHSGNGRAKVGAAEIKNPAMLDSLLKKATAIWINDSYWLVMPFKLKDSGVTLRYLCQGKTAAGADADILELTFESVGVTPQNKYHVWVDKSSRLVRQWAFFSKRENQNPDFINPWDDYRQYGKIWLSGNRGQRHLTEIDAPQHLPDSLFKNF